MKNSIFLIALTAIILTSCSKDESVEQFEEQNIDSVYVLNQFGETSYWDTMEVDEQARSTDYTTNNNVHTEGYYQPSSQNGMTISWSGTQTHNRARGRADLKQTSPNINFHFVLETECVMVNGNQAVYGGTITQVKALSGDVPNLDIGWRIYFKVIDSGLENDQIANTIIFASPRSISLCNVYPPTKEIWSTQGYSDVVTPGFVVVNN